MPQAKFVGGAVDEVSLQRLGLNDLKRVVFAGRSNVGKSSLLNALIRSDVARVSGEPGKTREMNFYLTQVSGAAAYFVDLPGYGYAKVQQKLKQSWGREITKWLCSDPLISCVVVLVDSRHGFLEHDLELLDFIQANDLPVLVAFTKFDKWKSANQKREAEKQLRGFAEKLGVQDWVCVSSVSKDGLVSLKNILKSKILGHGSANR